MERPIFARPLSYLREYYSQDPWSSDYLKSQGIVQLDKTPPAGEKPDRPAHTRNCIHDDVCYEAQIAVQHPRLIRTDQRMKANLMTLHGVNLAPIAKTIKLGKKLAGYRAEITKTALNHSLAKLMDKP